MSSAVEQRRIIVGDVGLNVALAGPSGGEPVVLLHGFPDDWHEWRFQVDALAAAGYRVVAPDLPGCGDSDRPTELGLYRLRRISGDVTGLMNALDIERATVVGHDFGAALAWHVALGAPHRVERLAVVSVGHPAASAEAGFAQRARSWYMLLFLFPDVAERLLPRDDFAFLRDWAWSDAPADDPDLLRQIALLSRPGALAAGLAWYRANISPETFATPHPSLAQLPRLTLPVLGVWGTLDAALGEEQMTGSARHLDGPWRYERLEGIDHWVPVHAPARLTELLLEFLGT